MAIKSPKDIAGIWWWTHTLGIDEIRGTVRDWTDQISDKELSAAAVDNRPANGTEGVGCMDTANGGDAKYLQETVTTTQTDDFICAFICRRASSPANGALIGRFTTASNGRSWVIDRNTTDDTVKLQLSSDGTSGNTTSYGFTLSRFLRHSCVVWKSGSNLKIYVDGTLVVDETGVTSTLSDPSGVKFMVGARLDGSGNPLGDDISFTDVVYGQITATTGNRDDLVQWIEEKRQGVVWSGDILGSDIDDTPVPTKSDHTLYTPPATLVEADPLTWRYAHHPVLNVLGNNVYAEWTIGYENEDAEGQQIIGRKVTPGPSPSFGSTEVIFPAQSTVDTGASIAGGRVLFTNPAQQIGKRMFHIAALVDVASNGSSYTDVALLARERNADGSLGTIFRLTSADYTADAGFTKHAYDTTLSPQLYERCVIANRYGGSSTTYAIRHGRWFDHPSSTANLVAPGGSFVLPPRYEGDVPAIMRLFRVDGTSTDGYVWSSLSYNFGVSWTTPVQTGIPDAPSNTWWDVGPDGRIIVVGNPHDGAAAGEANYRRWLYLATCDPGNRTVDDVYGLVDDADVTPTYSGAAKSGGPSYVHFIVLGNYVYAIYSSRKEDINLTRALIPGLADDNSDITAVASGLLRRGNLSGIIGTPLAGKF